MDLQIFGASLFALSMSGLFSLQLWLVRFRRMLSALGLEASLWNSVAAGRLSGLRVQVRLDATRGGWATTIEISGLPRDVRLVSASASAEMRRAVMDTLGRAVRTGDVAFDALFLLRSEEPALMAALDAGTRASLRELAREIDELRVRDGVLRARIVRALPDQAAVQRALSALLDFARLLAEGVSRRPAMEARLFHNAFYDPNAHVRSSNLLVLLKRCAGPVWQDAISTALSRDQPELRFLAARAAGGVAWRTMVALARDHSTPPEIRQKALAYLSTAMVPAEVCVEVASSCLGRPDPALVAAAARLLGRAAPPGDSSAESTLLGLLERGHLDVRRAAVDALAAVGTVRAVEPLIKLIEERGSRLEEGVRRSVRAIQARAIGAEAGSLSLSAVAEGGGLALAADAGAVSLMADPALGD
jgi:hypothetical protein